tara:strand:- start:152 stop:652 length:501 start_codon:yes stop_codon:yes gene_type:complete
MWTILKFKKKNLFLLKKDLLSYLGNDVEFYLPKIKIQKKVNNKLQSKGNFLLGDYLLCFHKSFENKKTITSLKYCKGLKYFLNNFIEEQEEISNFVNKCKTNEDEDGFIKQCFFEFKENGIFKFITGPFTDTGFKIIDRRKTDIKILIGKFTATVSKDNYLFRPVY